MSRSCERAEDFGDSRNDLCVRTSHPRSSANWFCKDGNEFCESKNESCVRISHPGSSANWFCNDGNEFCESKNESCVRISQLGLCGERFCKHRKNPGLNTGGNCPCKSAPWPSDGQPDQISRLSLSAIFPTPPAPRSLSAAFLLLPRPRASSTPSCRTTHSNTRS